MQQDTPATLYPDYAQTERGQELKGFLHWTLPQGYWTWVPIQVDPNRCTVLKGVRESSLGESKDCPLKSRDKMEPSETFGDWEPVWTEVWVTHKLGFNVDSRGPISPGCDTIESGCVLAM